ncbi:hypothetical protein EXU85_33600 [Spirosoma sp. KCTC 42546]|uniref:DUF6588 family protein n=1 Tax=Spirosoma sp. KCTC 42546 TaxID=2520506 RepID=UPI00115966F9|nr:DUF6588 family protein [Spirosoma sp. KCTC 42546]QDK83273.1 hypothetical protein EXU85_33600 [Spirosoma sp. KCTC 42546]
MKNTCVSILLGVLPLAAFSQKVEGLGNTIAYPEEARQLIGEASKSFLNLVPGGYNTVWFSAPSTLKPGKVDFKFTFTASIAPKSAESFTWHPESYPHYAVANGATSLPTVLAGPDQKAFIITRPPAHLTPAEASQYTTLAGSDTLQGSSLGRTLPGFIPQLSIGLPLNSELTVRGLTFGKKFGLYYWGAGLKHNLGRTLKWPFDLAIQLGFTRFNIERTDSTVVPNLPRQTPVVAGFVSIEGNKSYTPVLYGVDMWHVSATIGKTFSTNFDDGRTRQFTLYGGLQLMQSTTHMGYSGTLPIQLIETRRDNPNFLKPVTTGWTGFQIQDTYTRVGALGGMEYKSLSDIRLSLGGTYQPDGYASLNATVGGPPLKMLKGTAQVMLLPTVIVLRAISYAFSYQYRVVHPWHWWYYW